MDKYKGCMLFNGSLSRNEEQLMMGNSMHLSQVGSLFIYKMSFSLRRDIAMSLIPVPRPVGGVQDFEIQVLAVSTFEFGIVRDRCI